jgi:hydrogenase expression/formation protein HypC
MCLGIPGEVVAIIDDEAGLATVEVSGVRRAVSIKLVQPEGIAVGDWVLVHVGFALSKIDADEADATLEAIKRLGQPYVDEMAAFNETAVV